MSVPDQSVTPPRQRDSSRSGDLLPVWLPPLFYLILACLFLWRSTFTGEIFLPAGLLGYIAPYAAQIPADHLPPWNPLRWDGIAQFYPWRHFAATTLHAGIVPLWNPYQFCGTPFVADSQSAVFYPGNILFYLLPTARAFDYSALLHLTLAGWFLYLLLRRLGCTHSASLLGGAVYAYSAWQVAWLQLPTFLATSCWFPLLLRQVYEIAQRFGSHSRGLSAWSLSIVKLGAVVGLMLLAGHLQVAFYGLLAGILWALMLLVARGRRDGAPHAMRMLGGYLCGLALGLMLAAPQLLPTIELSRYSHRVGKPTSAGYAAYTEYALPTQSLVTLTLPNFYGNDYDPGNAYWGFYVKDLGAEQSVAIRHNAAETALYVGIAPLLLGGLALWRGRRDNKTLFFAGLAVLSLLLALGTPLNALFYFGIPGFGQSGSPARALVLWALALSILSAFGLDRLRAEKPSRRELVGAVGGLLFAFAGGISLAAQALSHSLTGFIDLHVPLLGDALGRLGTDWARLAIVTAGSLLLFTPLLRHPIGKPQTPPTKPNPDTQEARNALAPDDSASDDLSSGNSVSDDLSTNLSAKEEETTNNKQQTPEHRPLPWLAPIAIGLVIGDLFSAGMPSNPTSPPEWVYPETDGIRYVRQRASHERIFPVNQRWSLFKAPAAVLPPNGAMVYSLRDVQGYDSLLTGQYKAFANRFARPGSKDASPPEVGNMVFFQDPNASFVPETGALYALTLSPSDQEFVKRLPPAGSPVYSDEMAVYLLQNAQPRARLLAPNRSSLPNARVTYLEDGPTRVTLESDSTSPAELMLADQFYPGWHAFVDNRPAEITESSLPNGSMGIGRIVTVPAGWHRIGFRYEPTGYRIGLYLACLAISVLTAASTLHSRKKGNSA